MQDAETPEGQGDQAGPSASSNKNEKALLARVWGNFDQRYMKPLLTNSRPTLLETLPTCCTPIARFLTTTDQLNQSGPARKLDSDSDLCIDDANGARRNSINRVSIRLDDGFIASYKNRE